MSSTESSSDASSLVSENECISENEEMSDDGACEILDFKGQRDVCRGQGGNGKFEIQK